MHAHTHIYIYIYVESFFTLYVVTFFRMVAWKTLHVGVPYIFIYIYTHIQWVFERRKIEAGEKYVTVRVPSGLKIEDSAKVLAESSIFDPEGTRTMAYFSLCSAF